MRPDSISSFLAASPSPRAGDDDKVTIVDFGKMVVYPRPADFFLEMRAVKFIIDYHDAKRIEYERTRRAVARVERNLWRSKLRQAAKSQELADEVEPDEPPSQEEIEVGAPSLLCSPSPFTHFLKPVPPIQHSIPHGVGFRSHLRRHKPLPRVERNVFRSPTRYEDPTMARNQRLRPALAGIPTDRLRLSRQDGIWSESICLAQSMDETLSLFEASVVAATRIRRLRPRPPSPTVDAFAWYHVFR